MTVNDGSKPALLTDLIAAGGKPFDPVYLQESQDDDDGSDGPEEG
jgi:hypothetical protein